MDRITREQAFDALDAIDSLKGFSVRSYVETLRSFMDQSGEAVALSKEQVAKYTKEQRKEIADWFSSEAHPPLSAGMGELEGALADLTRPIINLELRTPLEVFDMMSDRICHKFKALNPPAPTANGDEVAWLIERDQPGVGIVYFGTNLGEFHWTIDANKALRLSRKQDADAWIEWWHMKTFDMGAKAVEHMWPASANEVG